MEQQELQQPPPPVLPGWLSGIGSLLVNKEIELALARHPYELLNGLASFGEAA